MSHSQSIVLPFALALAAAMTFSEATAGAKSYVGTKNPPGPGVSMDEIDHSVWDALLKKYVDDNGMVNFRGWRASASDRQQLSNYLSTLSNASRKLPATPEAKMAFWFNA